MACVLVEEHQTVGDGKKLNQNRMSDRGQNEGARTRISDHGRTSVNGSALLGKHGSESSENSQDRDHGRDGRSNRSFEKTTRPRNSTRPPRRHVPNLLAGSPLISGPVTPHFAPCYPPMYLNQNQSNQGNMAIFPTFMLAPSIVAEGSEEFVRQAMQNAIGLPPILYQYAEATEAETAAPVPPRKSKKKVRQKCDWRKGSAEQVIPPRIDSTFDFPLLDDGAPSDTAFVNSPRMIETPVSGMQII